MRRVRDWIRQLLGSPSGRRALEVAAAAVFFFALGGVAWAAGGGDHHGAPHINWWTWDQTAEPCSAEAVHGVTAQ